MKIIFVKKIQKYLLIVQSNGTSINSDVILLNEKLRLMYSFGLIN